MTISSTSNRKSYAGDGVTTAFDTTPVVFFDPTDLAVYDVVTATGVATTLALNTDFTVTGGNGAVGTVTAMTAPASGHTLLIVRTLPLTQQYDPNNGDDSDAENVEDAFDKATLVDQQLSAKLDRSFVLPDSDVSGASTTLPTPTASTLLGWDSAGTSLVNYAAATLPSSIVVSAFMQTVLDDANAAAARTTMGAVGLTGNETIAGNKTFNGTTSVGAITGTGLVDISGAAAGQIKFPATQNASANVNTLDDYEEGTWTPTVGGNATYNVQVGSYVKIGRVVYITAKMNINVLGTGSASTMSGLPFTASADVGQVLPVANLLTASANITIFGTVTANGTTITFLGKTASATSDSGINPFANSTTMVISGSYLAAS